MLQVSLELGGNAPCIVFDDADVDVAVKGAVCPIVACISTISNFVVGLLKNSKPLCSKLSNYCLDFIITGFIDTNPPLTSLIVLIH